MNFSSIISSVLIVAGALIMVLNIGKSRALFRMLGQVSKEDTTRLKLLFQVHEMLMSFFLIGYAVVAYTTAAHIHLVSELFVGVIFFFGAVFVLLGIILKSKMLYSIKRRYDQEVASSHMIREQSENLEQMNKQLIKEIHDRERVQNEKRHLEKELARSQRMEALGLLAGGVAHDLNNVLSGTVSYPDLILMDLPEDSPLRKQIRTIQESGKKAVAIVDDLLTMARRGVMHTEVLNLNPIVDGYLNSLEYKNLLHYHPNTEIRVLLEPELLNMRGSEVHLRKTLMNLVSNAAEALTNGGLIEISTENRYLKNPITGHEKILAGNYILLTVTDNGIGISPEDLERIFEPFYTKKVMGRSGTGLGMSVVWGTVQDLSGYISVQSEIGKGTTFQLYFPATMEDLVSRNGAIPVADYMGNGESVAVVDDIKEQREIAENLLTRLHYSVRTFSGSTPLIDYLKTNTVDLLILDMLMEPDLDGLDLYKKIIEIHPGQKAIITSGFSETERVKEALRSGVGQYIKKPYTLETLGLAIRKELKM